MSDKARDMIKKLEPDADNPSHFVTARGIGYKFVP